MEQVLKVILNTQYQSQIRSASQIPVRKAAVCSLCNVEAREEGISLLTATMLECRAALRSLATAEDLSVRSAVRSIEQGLLHASKLADDLKAMSPPVAEQA